MEKNKTRAIFNWSGGKDSALALYHILKEDKFQINQLVTTVNSKFDRVSMHGVRKELLYEQGVQIGLPIKEIRLPEMPTMEDYDSIMKTALSSLMKDEITHSIFGDIFLEDLRDYRVKKLNEVGLKGCFPLWKRDTTELVREFISLGFKTIVVCVKSDLLSKDFAGRIIDEQFLKDLPENVDPCGENGEFHTFVFDGPIFKKPINFDIGETIFRAYKAPKNNNDVCNSSETKPKSAGFYFCDLIPK